MRRPLAFAVLLACAGAAPAPPLTGLSPDRPESYLRAGEDLTESPETIELGRQTLALAVLLSAERDRSLAASALIALAGVARSPEEHAGLWSLAVSLDPARSEEWRWVGRHTAPADALRQEAARALGRLRRNDPSASLSAPVRARLAEEAGRLGLDRQRFSAVLDKWERDARNDPCRGRMFMPARVGDALGAGPCPDPSFHHGSRADDEWSMMVGVELSLLGAVPQTWSAQAALSLDAPVPVWSLDRLARDFGVSPERPVRRGGGWGPR